MKDQISFSARDKLQKNNVANNPFINYKENKQIFIDKLSIRKLNHTKKTSSSTSYVHKNKSTTLSSIKPIFSFKDTINKLYSKLYSTLQSYNISNSQYNTIIINDIVFNASKRRVSIFKDYLLWDETSDFFKEFYNKSMSVKLIPKITMYYETFTYFYPEYGPLEELLKIMKKNIKRKKKNLEMIEENEANKYTKNEIEEKFERLIKDSELKISETDSKISNINKCGMKKSNSQSTIVLSSFDKDVYNKSNLGDKKDLYSILKTFIDNYEDRTFEKINNQYEKLGGNNNKNNDNINNIIIFSPKFSKYIQRNHKNKDIQKEKLKNNIFKKNKSKNKNIKKLAQNFNLFKHITCQKRAKTNENLERKSIEREKIFKRISLKNRLNNPLIKIVNQTTKIIHSKSKENNSYSINKKYNTIKYSKRNIWINSRPHNIKKLIHRYNKLDENLIGNYFSLFTYKKSRKKNSRYSSHCLTNNSPINLRFNKKSVSTNKAKNKSKNNKNINYKNIKNTKFPNNNNHINIHFKYNRVSSNIIKNINLIKKNTIKKINPLINHNERVTRKKSNENLNKNTLTNPFREENYNTILTNSINQNMTINNSSKLYSSLTKISKVNNYKNHKKYNKRVSIDLNKFINKNNKKRMKMRNPKKKNNLILMKTNINFSNKKILINNLSEKKNKIMLSENGSITKFNLNKYNINTFIKIKNKKTSSTLNLNLNAKNNILKKIDKSTPKNELNIKLKFKNNDNSIVKTYRSNNINNSKKMNSIKLEEIDKIKMFKKTSLHKISPFNTNGYLPTKKSIKNKFAINRINNKKGNIFMKVPLTCRIKEK